MTNLSDKNPGGHYAKKQLASKSRLLAWSHRRRFEIALELGSGLEGQRILDYGCGDGTFLALLMSSGTPATEAVGVEIHPQLVEDCRNRLGDRPGLSFELSDDLDESAHEGRYEAIFCMEVLEHVVDVPSVLARLERLLDANGRLIVSVPVETGLPLAAKQMFRRLAGWRRIGDYPGQTPYTLRQFVAALFASPRYRIQRPTHLGVDQKQAYDHKGFNWMDLRRQLEARFRIEQTFSSPLRFLPPHLGSQAWFVTSRRLQR